MGQAGVSPVPACVDRTATPATEKSIQCVNDLHAAVIRLRRLGDMERAYMLEHRLRQEWRRYTRLALGSWRGVGGEGVSA